MITLFEILDMRKDNLMKFVVFLFAIMLIVGCTPAETVEEGGVAGEAPGEGEVIQEEPVVEKESGPVQMVSVTLYEWGIKMDKEVVNAGKIKFIMSNNGPKFPHAFKIENAEKSVVHMRSVNLDEVETLEIELEPGTYSIYCPLSAHRAKGMDIKLVVK